jgi:hypothetical protein
MTAQYVCTTLKRRDAVLENGHLNGIDFLEVLDSDAPVGTPPQQTLLVHLLQSASGLGTANAAISGGVRITGIEVVWAYQASATAPTGVEAALDTYVKALSDAQNVLVVRTSATGDFSTYTLVLSGPPPPTSAPPFAFDPQLSTVGFSFKVDCPSDLDCATAPLPAQPQASSPQIDYLAKDYESFRQLMLDRMSVTMPQWPGSDIPDVGVAVVEAMAYYADRLSYYQDAVTTEAYLGTARRRISVRRHARLLDYPMHDGCNARAWVCFELDDSKAAEGLTLKGAGAGKAGFALVAPGSSPVTFETLSDVTLHAAHNTMNFYTWSDEACCLPQGATSATLADPGSTLALAAGDVLIFEEVLGPATGAAADADPSHRCAVRLTAASPATDPVDGTTVVEIAWGSDDALPFTLCLSILDPQTGAPIPNVTVARGSVALVDQGLTQSAEPLSPSTVTLGIAYRPVLAQTGMTFAVPYDAAAAMTQPAATAAVQDPTAALPQITLTGPTGTWTAQQTLLDSGPNARDFVVETEDDGTATLRFGDGTLGAPAVSGLVARYRTGNGSVGNVGAEAIVAAVEPVAGIARIRNPLPAAGGTDAETLDQVRASAPQAFRTQQRAVTPADYGTAAQSFPGVLQARGTLRWTGSWYTVFVSVERVGGLAVDAAFKSAVRGYLEGFRLAGYDVEIEAPIYVPLDMLFTICVEPGYDPSAVRLALLETFGNGILANGRRGFFYPDNFGFGDSVYLSQIVATAMAVPGVRWIDTNDVPPESNHFLRYGCAPSGETAAGKITMAPLEIARLDNDPNAPENGVIDFTMVSAT